MGLFSKKGITLNHHKKTSGYKPVRIDDCKEVHILMKQHIGTPCMPTVKPGDTVFVGQVVGASPAFMSVPIHASVSGKVSKITEVRISSGEKIKCIIIESDGKMTPLSGIRPPKIDTYDQFLEAVKNSGLVGLGGAGFPAHVKLKVPVGKIDTFIVNAAECEPYITTDNQEMLDNTKDLYSGIKIICRKLGIHNAIIGVENNKASAIKILQEYAVAESNTNLSIKTVVTESRYPQGAEKVLIKSLTNRVVPIGKLPLDVGCIVMNITSVAFLGRYLETGKPLVSRNVTVDGSAIVTPMNVRVPIGIRIEELINFTGGYTEPPTKIIMGGPMMGVTSADLNAIITKCSNSVLLFNEKDGFVKPETDCIRCGKCVSACPMNLMPLRLAQAYTLRNTELLQQLSVNNCIECGCCSYVCPTSQELVQNIRLAKSFLRGQL